DNNCDGNTDETCPTCTDSDGDGFFAQSFCNGFKDCDDSNATINPGAQEYCGDGVDNNCDGNIDDPTAFDALTFYLDSDNDGYGSLSNSIKACSPPPGYVATGGDCNDNQNTVNPGALEYCGDGVDNNCDGQIDELGCTEASACTSDETNYLQSCIESCSNQSCQLACINNVSDSCKTALSRLYACGINAGCDGFSQDLQNQYCLYDNCPTEWQDVFGTTVPAAECVDNETRSCGNNVGACIGTQTCSGGRWSTCNQEVSPSQEVCDGIDNNCDGVIDNDPVDGSVYYIDSDLDSFGSSSPVLICPNQVQPGLSSNNGDCNDTDANINPDATEVCNGIDDNCNGQIDDGIAFTTYYYDNDGDGYGDPSSQVDFCPDSAIPPNYTDVGGDCNDDWPSINPGATEICDDLIDNNCDGKIDADDPTC
ncbi:MAG: putative metal-binding motif-containing protein, partial [Gammaproteobacteria bacterium]|nr:putative metal-binding motif-containing protein [Gammaproteobacteria bacterium]